MKKNTGGRGKGKGGRGKGKPGNDKPPKPPSVARYEFTSMAGMAKAMPEIARLCTGDVSTPSKCP